MMARCALAASHPGCLPPGWCCDFHVLREKNTKHYEKRLDSCVPMSGGTA